MRRFSSFSRGASRKSAATSTNGSTTTTSESNALVLHDPSKANASSSSASGSSTDARLKEKEKLAAEIEAEEISEVLPIRKPKHIVDGTASGIKLAAGGVLGGAAALVAMPVMGTYEGVTSARGKGRKAVAIGAAKGLASGLAKGVGSAAVMSIAGGVSGAAQITRGAVQTPFAVHGAAKGKQWDKESRQWVHYSLPAEVEAVNEADAEWAKKLAARREAFKAAAGNKGDSGVADTGFYEMLGVQPDASASEIKRAYLVLARKMHPDKNPDDPEANTRFQKLGEAYQVLSNEDTRARYDLKGMDGLDGSEKLLDPSTLYAMLFGSEKFDDLIGELQLASMIQQAESGDGIDPSLKHMSHKQRAREVKCAHHLAERLREYAEGTMEEAAFVASAKEQAKELSQTGFGEVLTHTIGRMYALKAEQALQSSLPGSVRQRFKMKQHKMNTSVAALKAMVSMYKVSKAAQGLAEDEQAKAMQKDMATFLEGAWLVSVVDVEATLRRVCKKVLTDTAVSREQRRRRALGLKTLGETFLEASSGEAGTNADGKPKTLRERLQEMMPPDMAAAAAEAAEGAEADEEGEDDDDEMDNLAPDEAVFRQEPVSRAALEAMSVSELKACLASQGVDTLGLLEKKDFVDALVRHNGEQMEEQQQPAKASNGSSGGGGGASSGSASSGSASSGGGAADGSSLSPGDRITVAGLNARPELNGRGGVVGVFDPSKGRYAVTLDNEDAPMLLKPGNLKRVQPSAGGDGGGQADVQYEQPYEQSKI